MTLGLTESVVEDAALAWLESLGYAVLHGPEIAAGMPGAERTDPNTATWCWSAACARRSCASTPTCRRGAGRRFPQADAHRCAVAHRAQPRCAPDAGGRRDGGVPPPGRLHRRRAGAGARLRPAGEQRLAGRQPVHRGRGAAQPPPGRGAVRQRPAARGDRAQEPGRRERHRPERLPAVPDLSGADPRALRHQRGAGGFRRRAGAHRRAGRGQGVVQALAHDRPGAKMPRRCWSSCRWSWKACSSSAGSSTWCATSSCSRTRAAGSSPRRWRATTSSTPSTWPSRRRSGASRMVQPCPEEVPGRYESGRKPGGDPGDRRVGVVWHTQGSGKSLTMAFYAGRMILHPAMENPTIVVLTDRNDLDDQLFGTFARCKDLLRQDRRFRPRTGPTCGRSCKSAAGGVVFTTIQKFFPEEKGDAPPGRCSGPAQHRRDRRRGAPQPVRLHRRLRPAHARRAAERLVHRLHRHAHREDRRQHPRRLRRLHQRLRHPAGGHRRGHRARSTTRAGWPSWS